MHLSPWFLMSALLCAVVGCSSPKRAPTPDGSAAPSTNTPGPEGQGVPGGGCAYVEFPGTCQVTSAGMMTYKGVVDGAEVTLAGNSIDAGGVFASTAVGKSAACSLKFGTEGGCTPCEIPHGACGQQGWDALAAFHARHAKAQAAGQ
jgi:hypothetical protein